MPLQVPQAPPDPILGISEAFKASDSPDKLNLGVGAYRTEELKPYVLDVVKKVGPSVTGPHKTSCLAPMRPGMQPRKSSKGRGARAGPGLCPQAEQRMLAANYSKECLPIEGLSNEGGRIPPSLTLGTATHSAY